MYVENIVVDGYRRNASYAQTKYNSTKSKRLKCQLISQHYSIAEAPLP
jgi:hypothetical protein